MDLRSNMWLACLAGLPAVYWIVPARFRGSVIPAFTAALLLWLSPLAFAGQLFAVVIAWGSQRFAHSGKAIALACALQLAPLIAWRFNAQMPLPGIAGIAVPLGLAYSALRGVHYVLEGYKGTLPQHRLADAGGYFFFLPTIIAGPIHRFGPWLADQRRVRWNAALFSEGLERILYGYVKIATIAGVLLNVRATGLIEAGTEPGSREFHYLTTVVQVLNGYFLFAGYSDVAIGFARLLGYRVMENFDNPLTKPNVQRFWGAWHNSLTSWCRDYVYAPVVALTRGRSLGIVISMAVLGLWHEFTWRYLAWGIYNGATIVAWHQWRKLAGERLERSLADRPVLRRLWYGVAVLITFHVLAFGWVVASHPTVGEGLAVMAKLLGLS